MASEDYIPKILMNDTPTPKFLFLERELAIHTKFKYILQSVKECEIEEGREEIVDGLLFFPPEKLDVRKNRELAIEQFQEAFSLVSDEVSCIYIWLAERDALAISFLEEDLELKKLGCEYTLMASSFFKKESFEALSSWFQEHCNERCQIKPAKH